MRDAPCHLMSLHACICGHDKSLTMIGFVAKKVQARMARGL